MTQAEGMTVDELKVHPYFIRLTPQQQTFVLTLCTNGNNKVAAAHKAWNCRSDESARAFANKTLAKPDIKWLTSRFFGIDAADEPFTLEELKSFVARKARTGSDEALVFKYVQAIMALEGWAQKPSESVSVPRHSGSVMDEVLALETNIALPKPKEH